MAQGSPRSRFNSSALVRVLTDLSLADGPGSKLSFAERLAEWLDFANALSLFAALNTDAAGAQEPRAAAPSRESAAARKALSDVRAALMSSIGIEGGQKAPNARIEFPAPEHDTAVEGRPDFAPYLRYYLARQRDMAAKVGPLRASVRAALHRHSPALGRLAGLDCVLEQALAGRERDLLAKVPVLLERRFERLYEAQRTAPSGTGTADDPARGTQAGGWLARFEADVRAALLAELDVRLQPVAGLVAALDNDAAGKQ